jgi:hypothetical protein
MTAHDAHQNPHRTHPTTLREDAVLLAAVSVLIVGLFADGWAHANIVDELEGFITPWHAIVFTGYLLTGAWIGRLIGRRRTAGRPLWSSVPDGYGPAVAGVAAFAVGFNGDAIWHTIFGLESDIDALLSPTHLLMAVALLAIVSAPWRARPPTAPRRRWRTDGTRVVSLLLATLVVGFFLLYLWIPAFGIGSVDYEQWLGGFGAPPFVDEVSQIAVLAASLVLTALVVVPVLLATRGGRPPTGALLAAIAFTAVAITAIREFSNGQSLAAFLAAGLLAEGLATLPASPRRRALLLGGLVPAVLWTVYWITFALVYDFGWEVELYAGQVVSATLVGLGLAALTARPSPTPTTDASHGSAEVDARAVTSVPAASG